MADFLSHPPIVTEHDKDAVKDLMDRLDVPWWLKDRYLESFAEAHARGRLFSIDDKDDK